MTEDQIQCQINRCQVLCLQEWGTDCVSYTFQYGSWANDQSKCTTYNMDCQSDPEGFKEEMADQYSYDTWDRVYGASSYFCHDY